MPLTPNKGYSVPTTGTLSGSWGDEINNNTIAVIDNNLGGITVLGLSNANVTLSASQAQMGILRLTGTLTGNVQVTTACKGFFLCENLTTGNFTVTLTNGSGASVVVPQSSRVQVLSDSTNGCRCLGVGFQPGDLRPTMANTAAALGGEWLFCDGATYPVASFPLLAAIMNNAVGGNFTVPDMRGRALFGRDNMNGTAANRLTAANGLDGTVIGNAGGEQVHTLSTGEMPSHNHSVTDPGHSHSIPNSLDTGSQSGAGGNAQRVQNSSFTTVNTNSATTGISISNVGGGAAHNNMPPAFVCNYLIKT